MLPHRLPLPLCDSLVWNMGATDGTVHSTDTSKQLPGQSTKHSPRPDIGRFKEMQRGKGSGSSLTAAPGGAALPRARRRQNARASATQPRAQPGARVSGEVAPMVAGSHSPSQPVWGPCLGAERDPCTHHAGSSKPVTPRAGVGRLQQHPPGLFTISWKMSHSASLHEDTS